MFRAFIAIEIEPSNELRKFSDELANAGGQLKIVDVDNLHITLKFLGDTREELVPDIREVIGGAVEGLEPFDIQMRGAGAFPNMDRLSVIWAGLEGTEGLARIAERIDEGTASRGYKREKRKFSPHITLARVKGGRNRDRVVNVINDFKDIDFGTVHVDRMILKKSVLTPTGPIYSDVGVVELERLMS